eukprot:scaffold30126_cov152-Isochrysis_galbana.AAC.1
MWSASRRPIHSNSRRPVPPPALPPATPILPGASPAFPPPIPLSQSLSLPAWRCGQPPGAQFTANFTAGRGPAMWP